MCLLLFVIVFFMVMLSLVVFLRLTIIVKNWPNSLKIVYFRTHGTETR
jgi:hypothetical protein